LKIGAKLLAREKEHRMSLHDHTEDRPSAERSSYASMRFGIVLLGFIIIAGVLLFTEHRAHVFGALFCALPLVCLFMHMFMHGGHGGHGGHENHGQRARERNRP
jgi:Protein of unknown function (DUF2933)